MDKDKLLSQARIQMLSKPEVTFISSIMFSLPFHWSKSDATASTDGLNMFFNPDFFAKLNRDEVVFVLVHETWHVALKHMIRMEHKNWDVYGKAADYVINLMITDMGIKLPRIEIIKVLYDERYRGMSTEQVYDLLMEEEDKKTEAEKKESKKSEKTDNTLTGDIKKPSKSPGDTPSNDGSGSGPGQEEILVCGSTSELEQVIDRKIMQASIRHVMAGKKAGNLPGELALIIDALQNPKLDLSKQLIRYASAKNKSSISYKKPSRRYLPKLVMPTRLGKRLNHIVVAVDSSGSVSDEQFIQFLSEIQKFRRALKPKTMTILDFDCQVRNIHKVLPNTDLTKIKFSGRGGTDLYPVFEYMKTLTKKPDVLVVFSDLECRIYPNKPAYPVLWVCNDNPYAEVAFGKLIKFET
jgi:predicted metal-dependent peptidase